MKLPSSLSLALALAASQSFASAQSLSGVADPLFFPSASAPMAVDADRIVFASPTRTGERPYLQLMRRSAASLNYEAVENFTSLVFNDWTRIEGVAMEGDLVAHQVNQSFGTETRLFIHERDLAGWSTQSVQLFDRRILRFGRMTAISNGRIASLHAEQVFTPFWINIVEQGATGAWAVTNRVQTSIRSPWFEEDSEVFLDGDVAAVGGTQGGRTGAISICEPDASGEWSETTLLGPPSVGDWSVAAIAIDGARLAAVRIHYLPASPGFEFALHTYERRGFGRWEIDARRLLPTPTLSPPLDPADWTLRYQGDELFASNRAETTVYSAAAGAPVQALRRVTGLGLLLGLDGSVAVGSDRSVGRVVDLAAQPGDLVVEPLAGQVTCPSTSTATLQLYRSFGGTSFPFTRLSARASDAPMGATALLFLSPRLASQPAASTGLCLDRQSAMRIGAPITVGAGGEVSFPMPNAQAGQGLGIDEAHHLQAVFLGAPQGGGLSVTNGVAWTR